jgi:hypothetical protein
MPSDRKSILILAATVTLAMFLGLYIGLYYATFKEVIYYRGTSGVVQFRMTPRTESMARLLFAPMAWLDRRIRPQVWDLPPRTMPQVTAGSE